MSTQNIESVNVTPYFDVELIMGISQEKRLGGAALERLATLWERWLPELSVRIIDTGKVKYLVAWLGESVESTVDASWAESPSQAYLDNALAQALCMGAVHTALPEIEEAGCAPAPRPTDALREALAQAGLPYKDDGAALSRRYAVVTHYPFKGACEICHLQAQCPKGQGQAGAASVVLPGYEHA